MASNLTKTTKSVKKFLIFFSAFILIIILADYFIKSTSPLIPPGENTNSKYYPIKNEIFSKIPYPKIKGLTVANPTKVNVSKDAVKFPEFPSVLNVYKIKPEQEHLNEANQSREIAKTLELTSGESKIINNVMYFETINADRVFSFDKAQRLWNYQIKTNTIAALGYKDIEKYKTAGLSFMGSMQLNASNYFVNDYVKGYITYLDNQGNYTNIISNNANSTRIFLNKQIIAIEPTTEKIPILYSQVQRPYDLESIASMTIINKGEKISSDLLSFSYKAHDYESDIGIYPILSPTEAFEKIQNDGGYLYSMYEVDSNIFQKTTNPSIKEFKLNLSSTKIIYVESEIRDEQDPWTLYLQPFYQFSGQAKSLTNKNYEFSFIVPAVADTSYNIL
jgi:hypothetical protein